MTAHQKNSKAGALKPKQLAVLFATHELLKEMQPRKIRPSMDEIATRAGMQLGVVHRHIGALKALGWLTYEPGIARSIQLLRPVPRRKSA